MRLEWNTYRVLAADNQSWRNNWAAACDFQQCGILTSVDSDEPVQPPVKLRNSKWCSLSSLTIIEYSSDWQWLWSNCAYAQADLRLCWSHIHIVLNIMHLLNYSRRATIGPVQTTFCLKSSDYGHARSQTIYLSIVTWGRDIKNH